MSASDGQNAKPKVCLICSKEYAQERPTCTHDDPESNNSAASELIGQVFADKYEIISVLGEGGMSIVYKARHRYMDRIVAVKVLHEHLVRDKNAVARFEHESKAASSLSHTNVVTVHDFGMTKDDQAYFVMDCLEGPSVADLLERKGRLALEDALPIFLQTLDGLEHAHKKRVVHRDLKPSNLVLIAAEDGSKVVKIVDFGIAKLMPLEGQQQQRITQSGEIFGSPLYMSPEQCQGQPLDQRSDLYSLGCLMYETLTGEPPHVGESFVDTVLKHTNQNPAPFLEAAPDLKIPEPIEACIMKCLEKDPNDRYQSAHELRKHLLDAALAAGIKGVRAGAVTATRVQDMLNQTFQRIGQAGSKRQQVQKRRFVIITTVAVFLFLLGGSLLTVLVWNVEDRVPNFQRYQWSWYQYWAQEALRKQNLDEARSLLKQAANLARGFSDRKSRLLETLYLLGDTYGKSGMFAEQENINNEIEQINTQQVLDEVTKCKNELARLEKMDAAISLSSRQKEAAVVVDRVLVCAAKLFTIQSMDQTCEDLLRKTIKIFSELKLDRHAKMADLKSYLAENLNIQQRLSEVRPLLLEALSIRESVLQAAPSDRAAGKQRIKAFLRLGQFDRDQSNFKEAETELQTALKLLSESNSNDHELNAEAFNSFADLYRQMGDKSKAAQFQAKADALEAKLPKQHAKELRRDPKHDSKKRSEVR